MCGKRVQENLKVLNKTKKRKNEQAYLGIHVENIP